MAIFLIVIPVWFITGWSIVRYGLGTRELLVLPPLALGTGGVLYFWLINILLRVVPVLAAAWLTLGLMLALAVGLWYRRRDQVEALRLGCRPELAAALLIVLLALGGVLYVTVRGLVPWDEIDHGPRAALIARVGLPVGSYAMEGYCTYYHYAVNAVDGVLFRQSGLANMKQLVDFTTVYHVLVSLALCFVFLWELGKRKTVLWPFVGAFIFLTLSPAVWLQIGDTLQWSKIFDSPAPPLPLPHRTWGFRPLTFSYQFSEDQAFSMVLFLALIAWIKLEQLDDRSKKWTYYLVLGQVAALSALYFEVASPLITVPIGLGLVYRLVRFRHQSQYHVKNLLAYTVPALAAIALQGGLISDMLLCPPLEFPPPDEFVAALGTGTSEVTSVRLRTDLSYRMGYEEVDLTIRENRSMVLYDFGLGLIVLPFSLLYYIRRRHLEAILILSTVLLFLAVFFFVEFSFSRENMLHFIVIPMRLAGAMSVLLLHRLWISGRRWAVRPVMRLFIIALITGMILDGAVNFLWQFRLIVRDEVVAHGVLAPLDSQVQREWFGKLDPSGNAVYEPIDIKADGFQQVAPVARPIMIFGTYGSNGHFFNIIASSRRRLDAWNLEALPGDLTKLGFKYLYVTEASWTYLLPFQKDNIENPEYYELIQEWRSEATGQFRRFYKIVGEQRSDGILPTGEVSQLVLSPENYALYQAYDSPLARPQGKVFQPLDFWWNAAASAGRRIQRERLQGDALYAVFDLLKVLDWIGTQDEIDGDLAQWQVSRMPGSLAAAGVDYLFFDHRWYYEVLTPFQREVLFENRSLYEFVGTFTDYEDSDYFLFKITGDADTLADLAADGYAARLLPLHADPDSPVLLKASTAFEAAYIRQTMLGDVEDSQIIDLTDSDTFENAGFDPATNDQIWLITVGAADANPILAAGREHNYAFALGTAPDEALRTGALKLYQLQQIPDLTEAFRFGNEQIALMGWNSSEPLNPQPCDDIWMRTWWRSPDVPEENYSITLVLWHDDGTPVVQSDGWIGELPMKLWVPGQYYFDERALSIPCDLTPGTYDLTVGLYLYQNEVFRNLRATAPDGTVQGDRAFVTSLEVGSSGEDN